MPLYIPDKGYAQAVVDDKDSAAYMMWDTMPVIADHCNQGGTWRLQYSLPKITIATLELNGKTTKFKCSKKQRGTIRNGKMHDESGQHIRAVPGVDLCIYTCTGRKQNGWCEVWLTYWVKM